MANAPTVVLPAPALVLLIGASGSGKSTLARRHFAATEIISSDHCRAMICDDESDQRVTPAAFALVHFLLELRLARGRLTVVDATNVRAQDRAHLLTIAAARRVPVVAVVLDLPAAVSHARNSTRTGRNFGPEVVETQLAQLHQGLSGLAGEGIQEVAILRSVADVDGLCFQRLPEPAR